MFVLPSYAVGSFAASLLGVHPVTQVPTGSRPEILVTNFGSNTASIIKGRNVITGAIKVGNDASGVAFDPNLNRFYVTSADRNTISVISAESNTLKRVFCCYRIPDGIAFVPSTNMLFVLEWGSSDVAVINPLDGTVSARIALNACASSPDVDARTAFYNPGNNGVYINDPCSNIVTFIKAATLAHFNILVGNMPEIFTYSPASQETYVGNYIDSTISVIARNNTVVRTLSGFAGPLGMTFDAKNGDVYVVNNRNATVSILDSSDAVIGLPIQVGACPNWIVYNPGNSGVYTSNFCVNTISVIRGSTVIATISNSSFNEPYAMSIS
jgi:DNA-binding beta-propeller fold protein YncE